MTPVLAVGFGRSLRFVTVWVCDCDLVHLLHSFSHVKAGHRHNVNEEKKLSSESLFYAD